MVDETGRGRHFRLVRRSCRRSSSSTRDTYLPFEPLNENGVVFIFALAASRLGFDVKQVQAGFPDCTATWAADQCDRVRVPVQELPDAHGHDPEKCDLIICWQHNWPRRSGRPAGAGTAKVLRPGS